MNFCCSMCSTDLCFVGAACCVCLLCFGNPKWLSLRLLICHLWFEYWSNRNCSGVHVFHWQVYVKSNVPLVFKVIIIVIISDCLYFCLLFCLVCVLEQSELQWSTDFMGKCMQSRMYHLCSKLISL